ncbi:hemerythrin domain-containing protein [Streptomyces sp. NPDC059506]|uniref:hemerythrin domain-containing protein n=1 Tax=Streptomyces sp. NPDC059506 TaxID=3347751 RepID=UPI0036804E43
MRFPKVYAVVAAVVAAIVGMTTWAWAATTTGAEPRPPAPAQANGGRVTAPLRAEHRELLPKIEALASAAEAVGTAPPQEQRKKVDESYAFLTRELIPHAVAEDEVLYAKVDSVIGTADRTRPTDTMRRDHAEVVALTEDLGRLRDRLRAGTLHPADQKELRRVLYALNAVVDLHFAKEEEVYLPLLDRRLTAEEARRMFERMDRIAEEETAGAGAARH